ncbi:MAG: hypothetical protein SGILL_008952 [Bacillariaceae sp.]
MSPSSAAGQHSHLQQDVLGGLEPMPQYSYDQQAPQQQRHQPHPQHGDVYLGLQPNTMDYQQQQQQASGLHHSYPPSRDRSNPVSEDDEMSSLNTGDNTHPSTSQGGNNNNNINNSNEAGYTRSDAGATSTFGKLIQSAAKGMNNNSHPTGDGRKHSVDEDGIVEGALIYGYLQKLGRNGKWQTRWFETDGECLTYYKSDKRAKLLATLDLAKVGSIVIDTQDEKGCRFIINISERPYHLRADSSAACKDWVITLNRVKEARMMEGNVKLVMPNETTQPPDLLDSFTPRVVVVANRQRTHAVEDDDIASWEANLDQNPANPIKYNVGPASSAARLARWQKPKTSIKRIAQKIVAWARSIRKHGCQDAENQVILDHHLHPPGHDDKPSNRGLADVDGAATGAGAPYSNRTVATGQPQSGTSVGTDNSPHTWIQNQNSTDKSFPREVVTTDLLDTDSMNNAQQQLPTQSPSADVAEDDDEDDGARYLS